MIHAKVVCKTNEAIDIYSYELSSADGNKLPAFSAGSHIDVTVPGGLTRQYSLCNDPAEHHRYRIAVLRDPQSRGGSRAMHEELHEGDVVLISEPRNHFPLVHAHRTVLFAGGIGVTPLLCMAQRLSAIGADFVMHYCTRSADRAAFRDEILASPFADKVIFHFDDGAASQKLDLPAVIAQSDLQTHLYVCGPTGFIDWVLSTARETGWQKENVHSEYFGAAQTDLATDKPFTVKIASSGKKYLIPAGKSVTQALEDEGLQILVSCEQGVCGTCITRVLQGECDHRDHYLTDEEKAVNDQFTPCCSRSKTDVLVLDL